MDRLNTFIIFYRHGKMDIFPRHIARGSTLWHNKYRPNTRNSLNSARIIRGPQRPNLTARSIFFSCEIKPTQKAIVREENDKSSLIEWWRYFLTAVMMAVVPVIWWKQWRLSMVVTLRVATAAAFTPGLLKFSG